MVKWYRDIVLFFLQQVMQSGILDIMNSDERKRQEVCTFEGFVLL